MGGKKKHIFLGGGNSNIFGIGEDFQFDEHIFQMGSNHQPVFSSMENFNPFNPWKTSGRAPVPRGQRRKMVEKLTGLFLATGDFSSAVPLYLHELDHAVYTPESGFPDTSRTSPVKLISTRCLWLKCGSSNRRWVNDDT